MRRSIPIVLALLVLGGCASHYKVTDQASSKTYYTTHVKDQHGTVTFKDAKTGSDVTLSSAEVEKISKSEYKDAVKK